MTLDLNPFPGPRPYTAAEKDRFFGRETIARRLLSTMRVQRCVTLYGPSGAGKSSIMQASILPAVERDERGFHAVFVEQWPENEAPLMWLAMKLHERLAPGVAPHPDPRQAIDQALEAVERPLFLYVDQIEQILLRRSGEDVRALVDWLDDLVERPQRELHLIIGIREEDLGRWRDRIRGRRRLTENWLRLGPLTAGEIIGAVCAAAKKGSPGQTWREADVRPLMREVRVPGQPGGTDDAEVQAAYAQIVCRTLFKEGRLAVPPAAGGPGKAEPLATEPILQRYFAETLDGLDQRKRGLRRAALRLLEEHFVHEGDGSRRPLTESQARALAKELAVKGDEVGTILEVLSDAVILRPYDHQGERYYELGHDWLAKWVFERGKKRRQRREVAEQILLWLAVAAVGVAVVVGAISVWALKQKNRAEDEKRKAVDAQNEASAQADKAERARALAWDATVMAGVREHLARDEPDVALGLLLEVKTPQNSTRTRENSAGWIELAEEVLNRGPFSIKLAGHLGAVTDASFSPDGQHVVTASRDATARVWKVDGSDKDHPLVLQHDAGVWAASYSPDGTHIATAGDDGSARVWKADGSDRDHPLVLSGHKGKVWGAAYSPDGTHIVTASFDGTARVWKADGSDKMHPLVFDGHNAAVLSAAFSPDGQRFVTTSADGHARVWRADGSDMRHPVVLLSDKAQVLSAAYSPDGSHVAISSSDGVVRVSKADGSDRPLILQRAAKAVNVVVYSSDGQHIVAASSDTTARVWKADGSDKAHPLILRGHTAAVLSTAYSADGKHIVTAAEDLTARVWKVEDFDNPSRAFKGHEGAVWSASYSGDGQRIVTASADRTARVWKADGSDKDHPLVLRGHAEQVCSAAYSPDGRQIVTASWDKTARVWKADDADAGDPVVLPGHADWVLSAAYGPKGEHIVTASKDKTARVWKADGSDKDHPLVLRGHTDAVSSAAFSPDGQHIVTASADMTARVWKADGSDRDRPLVLRGHLDKVNNAAFSPDGQHIVTASDDLSARVWKADGSDGNHPLVLRGHTDHVMFAAYSRDGQYIATASADRTARVWKADGSDRDRPLVLVGHSDGVLSAAYSPDGQHIITASADMTVRIWAFDVPTLVGRLRAANPACLPSAVRQAYLLETEAEANERYEGCRRELSPSPAGP